MSVRSKPDWMLRGTLAVALATCVTGCSAPLQPEAQAYASGPRIAFPDGQLPSFAPPQGKERQVRSALNVDRAMQYGEFVWNEDGVPAGEVWVVIDLGAQTISAFRGEHEIGTAVTLYGAEEKPTPLGTFPVKAKLKDHWSSLYDAPMPYTLRLTDDGVAIHGSEVRSGAATHGCLGVPLKFARLLFEEVQVGNEVLIVRDAARHIRT